MKVLVTGGCGFIGSNFIRHVLESRGDGVSVVNLDKLTYAANPANLADVAHHPNYRFVRGDIVDPDVVGVAMEGCTDGRQLRGRDARGPLAPRRRVLHRDGRPRRVRAARGGRRRGIRKFVQISTDEVYGSIAEGSFTEESPLNPRNPLRGVEGGRRPARLLLLGLLRHAGRHHARLQQLRPLPVPGEADPRSSRPTPSTTCRCRSTATAATCATGSSCATTPPRSTFCSTPDVPGETYNIAGGNEAENIAITRLVLSELGKPESLIRFVDDRPGHDRRYSLDAEARPARLHVLDPVRGRPLRDRPLVPRPRGVVAPDQGARRRLPRVLPHPVRAAPRPPPPRRRREPGGDPAHGGPERGPADARLSGALPRACRSLATPRRVLVTGAGGMLGSDLPPLLASAGYEVFARPQSDLDIADSAAVARAFRAAAPDVVVNCAAFTKVDDCETDPRAEAVNARGPAHLARRCRIHGAAQLVQISTDFVFDGMQGRPLHRGGRAESALRLRAQQAPGRGGGARAPQCSRRAKLVALRPGRLELRRGDPEAGGRSGQARARGRRRPAGPPHGDARSRGSDRGAAPVGRRRASSISPTAARCAGSSSRAKSWLSRAARK